MGPESRTCAADAGSAGVGRSGRARTGDLLGAIQNPEIPARSVIPMDSSIFQAVWPRPVLSHTAFPPIAVHVRVANGLQALLPPRATARLGSGRPGCSAGSGW